MKKIKLTQGKFALVDDADYEWLNQYKWHARRGRSTVYVGRCIKRKIVHMHREILQPSAYLFVDHINQNGLDNRRCNLRIVTNTQNQWNCSRKISGAYWHKHNKKWAAKVRHNGKEVWLGYYTLRQDAEAAYLKTKLKLLVR